ncbi:N-(5'-phosphoribosyl)anthranilate isomerase [Streptomyces solincola]|uniref:N-(5'-phosphoribosyl)anthranilate isomerase n=1 Tax=Streptomyces solincola TaxID=2100817 RepID=A0A2S9PXR6_9ACTN|nr:MULTISPECIES: N-(5'-phosphoribosyl)anthranilate isomerase [Streptomyces]PRH79211.1 N-(5'-phosphoribosyl)anthranilate isomerase [Streptomyces solincola]
MNSAPAPVLKVCGATAPHDIEVLAAAGADHVGLWHGVPGGRADLTGPGLAALAAAARATGALEPVLVTFLADPDALADAARRSGVTHLQLHAYQRPDMVRALRAALPDAVLIKVLHLAPDGGCVERPLIKAYARAGADLFLFDAATGDGRVGSTGVRLAGRQVTALADRCPLPFWLAGGLDPASSADYADVAAHPGFRGIDVDTAARDAAGRFTPDAVADLARAWGTARHAAPAVRTS